MTSVFQNRNEAVPLGYKHTELGVIPEDWEIKRLGDLGGIVRGGSPRPAGDSKYFNGNFIPWLTVAALTNISENQLRVFDTVGFLTEEGAKHSRTLANGTLIIANSGATLGVAKLLGVTCCANDGIAAIINQKAGDKEFVCHFINSQTKRLREVVATGNGQPNLNTTLIRVMPIPFPPSPEQRAIASALSDVDGLIDGLEQLIAKKRDLKQAAMQQLLTGKKRLAGFSGEWAAKRLGDFGVFLKGFGIKKDEVVSDGLPCIRYGEIYTRHNDHLKTFNSFITPATAKLSQRIVQGDLLFAGSGETLEEIGKCVAFLGGEEAYAGGDIVIFRPVGQDSKFLGYLMNHSSVASQKARMGQGEVVVHISARNLARLELHLPAKPEQTAIAEVLSDMDVELAALEHRRDKTRALKQGMMQELLTGRIRLVSTPSNIIRLPAATASTTETKTHNWQINEAVVISVLAKQFGKEQFPLGRKRYTKLSYLLHRRVEHVAEGYLKQAAGPYNPATKYKGPEAIAQRNQYIRPHTHQQFSGFVAADNIGQAEAYFQKWYGAEVLQWLEQFRYKKNDELELLATVDMAMEDLDKVGQPTTLDRVKDVIHNHPEWEAKLNRPIFSDVNISGAIKICAALFK